MERDFDPEGYSAVHAGFADLSADVRGAGPEVERVHERQAVFEDGVRQLEAQSRVQGTPAQALGSVQHNPVAAGQAMAGPTNEREKRDREFREMLDLAGRLDWLNQEIARLQGEIDANNQRIRELEEGLNALDELEQLLERGELDPTNGRHARLIQAAGLDPASITNANALPAIRERREGLRGEISELRQENQRMQNRVERLTRERDDLQSRLDHARHVGSRLSSAESPREVAEIMAAAGPEATMLAARLTDNREAMGAVYEAAGLSDSERDQDDRMTEAVSTADFSAMLGAPAEGAPAPDTDHGQGRVASPSNHAAAIYGDEFSGAVPPMATAFAAATAGQHAAGPEGVTAGPRSGTGTADGSAPRTSASPEASLRT